MTHMEGDKAIWKIGGSGTSRVSTYFRHDNSTISYKNDLERSAIESESLVLEKILYIERTFPSTARPEKSRRNPPGLSGKAKYFW